MIKLFILILILILVVSFASAKTVTHTGTVTRVIDGDTLDLSTPNGTIRVRLHGIDAPESRQPHGKKSRQYLRDLIHGKTITVISSSKDRHNRVVGKVLFKTESGRTVNVNELMVAEGNAWWSKAYAPNDSVLRNAQKHAYANRMGLWYHPSPIAPWLWRKQNH